ncbi:hypothetical protein ABL78_2624 [Leptomonas seymouri]|uniref:Uncharacterized protein n=1 Tax=Leptomonas seymouri TaxID=5684 RepID=A0A0N1PD01_LEPSE|nr:hypothetical protein ABL78_2624 [Leptomonas seymouri]|eukprot:KPI88262.1 hypothetical protein ABL78_2624 [Leptomonas seymouri]
MNHALRVHMVNSEENLNKKKARLVLRKGPIRLATVADFLPQVTRVGVIQHHRHHGDILGILLVTVDEVLVALLDGKVVAAEQAAHLTRSTHDFLRRVSFNVHHLDGEGMIIPHTAGVENSAGCTRAENGIEEVAEVSSAGAVAVFLVVLCIDAEGGREGAAHLLDQRVTGSRHLE